MCDVAYTKRMESKTCNNLSKYSFREIALDEIPKVKKLYKIVFEDLCGKEYIRPFTQETYDTFYDIAYNVGAYDGKTLVGMGRLRTVERDELDEFKTALELTDKCVAECSSYLVLPKYRGQGIMKKLQDILLQRARELGFRFVLASVHPENVASQKVLCTRLQCKKTIKIKSGKDRMLYLTCLKKDA